MMPGISAGVSSTARIGSPRLATRAGTVLIVWRAGSSLAVTSFQVSGVDTGAPGCGRTANGASAHPSVTDAVAQAAARHPGVSHVVNGRFKGGYITRHYGDPAKNVHAVQLEMCQCLYMGEQAPYAFDEALAAQVRPVVEDMMASALDACRKLHGR